MPLLLYFYFWSLLGEALDDEEFDSNSSSIGEGSESDELDEENFEEEDDEDEDLEEIVDSDGGSKEGSHIFRCKAVNNKEQECSQQ